MKFASSESDAVSAYKSFRSCEETFDRLGFAAAARDAGIELVNLSRRDALEIRLDGIPQPVRIPQLLLEEMYFISIANLKLHGYTRMTGVLKNSIGLLTDAEISSLHPYLSILISRLHKLCTPDLCIIDGRIGLEGSGPIIGRPVRMDYSSRGKRRAFRGRSIVPSDGNSAQAGGSLAPDCQGSAQASRPV